MSVAAGPKGVTDNLALCLDPGSTESYPGSGTDWFDLSGNGNDATLTGSPTFSGGTMTLNGTSQYATVTANQTTLDFTNDQTIMIWLKRTDDPFVGRRNPWDQAYGGYGTWTSETSGSINYYYGTAGSNTTPYTNRGSAAISTGVWTCMAVTRDTSFVTWYKDGAQSNQAANAYGATGTTSINIRIGLGYAGYFVGEIGPVLAYTRALTASEIKQNFDAYKGRFGI